MQIIISFRIALIASHGGSHDRVAKRYIVFEGNGTKVLCGGAERQSGGEAKS